MSGTDEARDLAGDRDPMTRRAVDRLCREVRERQEAEAWTRAADDPEFRAELRDIAEAYGDRDALRVDCPSSLCWATL